MARATKRQLLEREKDIHTAIKKGQDPSSFAAALAKKHKCSENSILRLYREIIRDMRQAQAERRSELQVELERQAKYVQDLALEQNLLKSALDAINLRAKIGGVYKDEAKEEAKEPPKPVFNFMKSDNSVPLSVVPKDEDDDTGS
jgi:hypothetical protein